MPIRNRPGRPGRDEDAAPQRKRTLYVPVEVDAEFERRARVAGVSCSLLLRRALVEWLEEHPGGERP